MEIEGLGSNAGFVHLSFFLRALSMISEAGW